MLKTKSLLQAIAKEYLLVRRGGGTSTSSKTATTTANRGPIQQQATVDESPPNPIEPSEFKLQRALIVTKLSRYEFERLRYPHLNERQLEQVLRNRGTDYENLIHRHNINKNFERTVLQCFQDAGCEVKLINRSEFRSCISKDVMHWADVIVPIGGDGTFLLAAGRASPLFAQSHYKIPIVGFNSDPLRSEGRLMLPKYFSEHPADAVAKIKCRDFRWIHRSRIRTTFLTCSGELPESTDLYRHTITKMEQEKIETGELSPEQRQKFGAKMKHVLPYLALNDVFIGETLASRVSHLHLIIDQQDMVNKTKCSGLCVSTGTGSTSWHTSINRITKRHVEDLFAILPDNQKSNLQDIDVDELVQKYNQNLVFPPDDPRLSYSIREQICVRVWPSPKEFQSRKFVNTLFVKSSCIDANLVIDGSICYPFNDGAKVILETHPQDSLLAISLD